MVSLLRSKRAAADEESLSAIIEAIIGFIFLSGLIAFIYSLQDVSYYEKQFLARDSALLLTTMYAANGDITYTYAPRNIQMNDYVFVTEQARIAVSKPRDTAATSISYPFALDSDYSQLTTRASGRFVISIQGRTFSINNG